MHTIYQTITDPEVLSGSTEGTIEVDFATMTESDKTGESMYEVGGRVYFEAYVAASGW